MKMSQSTMLLDRSRTALRRVRLVSMGFALVVGIINAADAKRTPPRSASTNASPVEVPVPRSSFDSDSPTGRDPFFPHSGRRVAKATLPQDVTSAGRFPEQVRLSGVSGTPDRRLALINRRTFAAGESGQIRVNGKPVSIRVEAVKEAAAVVTINGVTREIHLREGI